jgi:hypothetical protein
MAVARGKRLARASRALTLLVVVDADGEDAIATFETIATRARVDLALVPRKVQNAERGFRKALLFSRVSLHARIHLALDREDRSFVRSASSRSPTGCTARTASDLFTLE